MKILNEHRNNARKRKDKNRFPRYTLRLPRPLAEDLNQLGRIEKRRLPDLVRGCISKAIAELRRKREQHDNRVIKLNP